MLFPGEIEVHALLRDKLQDFQEFGISHVIGLGLSVCTAMFRYHAVQARKRTKSLEGSTRCHIKV